MLAWISGKVLYLDLFSANFHSCTLMVGLRIYRTWISA